jgi:hypothetical protein
MRLLDYKQIPSNLYFNILMTRVLMILSTPPPPYLVFVKWLPAREGAILLPVSLWIAW